MACRFLRLAILVGLALTISTFAQDINGSISGRITDSSGAAVGNAQVTLNSVATGAVTRATTGAEGLYSFPDLPHAAYMLAVSARGFRDFLQRGIAVDVGQRVRVDIQLVVGAAQQTVQVTADASPLNYENGERKETITPQVLAELPLEVAGGIRSAGSFTVLFPGVSAPINGGAFDARVNGGLQSGDEAVLDGVSMQEGLMSQSGAISVNDFPLSPDMVSEVSLLTSNYEPQFGASTSGQIVLETKSGTNDLHGSLFEFHRNTVLNARQFGVTQRPPDLEHDFGGSLGGPFWIPHLWPRSKRTFFYLTLEGYRSTGGVVAPVITVPTMAERSGDFQDWPFPVYDPDTIRPNPNFDPTMPLGPGNEPVLRDQFMGCGGNTANVICPSDPRMQDSLAQKWLQFLPPPNRPGISNNLVVAPRPNTFFFHRNLLDLKLDQYVRDNDHFAVSIYYTGSPPNRHPAAFPLQIDPSYEDDVSYGFIDRLNWDHTLTPTLLNHASFGYLNYQEGTGSNDSSFVNVLPQIPGVPSHSYPPTVTLEGYVPSTGSGATFGDNNGIGTQNLTGRPAAIADELLTWVKGTHTFKFGGEYRWLGENNRTHWDESGDLDFSAHQTGLPFEQSGNSIASFLLGEVNSASVTVRNGYYANYPRQHAWVWHAADTWKPATRFSINYGVRWDYFSPADEKRDVFSFFDPLGSNPGAGGRPGRLAFAGTKWGGAASYGRRHPERNWYGGYAPRVGIAYTVTPATVVRTGYGIFYTQAYYPGWGGGISQEGFSANPSFGAPDAYGITPAFLFRQSLVAQGIGFPQNFSRPPFIDPTLRNGQGAPLYRPFNANRLGYSQQWNLTVEHQFTTNFYVSTGYVGTKGTRLASQINPLNVLNPQLLAQYGNQLNDTFSGDTQVDGVPAPYPGWANQLNGTGACVPTVAQALLVYPQYCGTIFGLNENDGNSTYHSLQIKAEKRLSHSIWMLTSYTFSKTIDDADNVNAIALTGSGAHGVISPFEQHRNKALAIDDVPQTLSVALAYDLPLGAGKRFLNNSEWFNALVAGWQLSSILRFSSGIPFFFRSSNCNVPGQFGVACIPAQIPGVNPFTTGANHFDPHWADATPQSLFDINAFERSDAFNGFYYGKGPRVSNLRGPGYRNQDLALSKNFRLTEKIALQLRGEAFNLWNWHTLSSDGSFGSSAFDTNVASPTFGQWNGTVTTPRNVQLAARINW